MSDLLKEKVGKYLTFVLGPEQYGFEILKVREIIGYMDITKVPQSPTYVKGVINLRGKVIAVMDLRLKFGMSEAEVTDETCIIVVDTMCSGKQQQMGVIVDAVSEVIDVGTDNLEGPPLLGAGLDDSVILAMAKIGDSVKVLLDVDRVVAGDVLELAEALSA